MNRTRLDLIFTLGFFTECSVAMLRAIDLLTAAGSSIRYSQCIELKNEHAR